MNNNETEILDRLEENIDKVYHALEHQALINMSLYGPEATDTAFFMFLENRMKMLKENGNAPFLKSMLDRVNDGLKEAKMSIDFKIECCKKKAKEELKENAGQTEK